MRVVPVMLVARLAVLAVVAPGCAAEADGRRDSVAGGASDRSRGVEPVASRGVRADVTPSMSDSPARSKGRGPPEGWTDLGTLAGIRLDVRYATANNFTGAPLPGYGSGGAWLRVAVAEALADAAGELAAEGMGLVVFDAYRPRRASRAMAKWARVHGREDLLEGWVSARSQHNRGTAVDVGLFELETGRILEMGSEFDAFVPASHHSARVAPEHQRRRRRLRQAMEGAAFEPYWREWWHYGHPAPGEAIDLPYGIDDDREE